MTERLNRTLVPPPGSRSKETGLYLAMLDDQTRLLRQAIGDLSREELEWQPVPGQNTIGMLLTHLALVELYWIQVGVAGRTEEEADADCARILGIGINADGLPLEADGLPPAGLAGKDLAFFHQINDVAREHTSSILRDLSDADLERRFQSPRADYNVRWVLYHVLEHFSWHFGQVLLLRHQARATSRIA